MQIEPNVTDGVASSVSLSVMIVTSAKYRDLCKNGWTDWYVVWDVDLGGPKEPCIRRGCTVVPRGKYDWLNCPCAAAMRPYVKLLWPLVLPLLSYVTE